MKNNNGIDIFGFNDNLGGVMNKRWLRIGDGKNIQRYQQICFKYMRKEVGIGGGDVQEGECSLSGRVVFIGQREMRRVGDQEAEIKRVDIGFIEMFGKEMKKIEIGKVGRAREEKVVEFIGQKRCIG